MPDTAEELTAVTQETLKEEEMLAFKVVGEVSVATLEEIVEQTATENAEDITAVKADIQESTATASVQATEIPLVIEEEIVASSEVEEMATAAENQVTIAAVKMELIQMPVANEEETVTAVDIKEMVISPVAKEEVTGAAVNFEVAEMKVVNKKETVTTEGVEEVVIKTVIEENVTASSVNDEIADMPVANEEETVANSDVEEVITEPIEKQVATVTTVGDEIANTAAAYEEEKVSSSNEEIAANEPAELKLEVAVEPLEELTAVEEVITKEDPPVEYVTEASVEDITTLNAKKVTVEMDNSETDSLTASEVTAVEETPVPFFDSEVTETDLSFETDLVEKIVEAIEKKSDEPTSVEKLADTHAETDKITAEVQGNATKELNEPINSLTVNKEVRETADIDEEEIITFSKAKELTAATDVSSTVSELTVAPDSTDDVKTSIRNAVQSLNCLKKATEPVEAVVTANGKTVVPPKEVKFHSTAEIIEVPIPEAVKKAHKAEFVEFESDKVALWCTPVTTLNNGPGTDSLKMPHL